MSQLAGIFRYNPVMFRWPWQSNVPRIADLTALELATMAQNMLQKLGRNSISFHLLYRAFELDPYQPQAILMLSDIYRGNSKGGRPVGDEIYAGIILEYARDFKSKLSEERQRLINKARTEIMLQWGFVKRQGEETEIDHIGYMHYINESLKVVRSVNLGFQNALLKLGVQGGVIDPRTGSPTRGYKDWLKTEASTLDAYR